MEKLLFIDAETDGLYGSFITVAIIVTDKNGNETERHYLGIKKENLNIKEPWVAENVLPHLGEYEACRDEDQLLDKVWEIWSKYREQAYIIGDVIHPVESRLLQRCVEKDLDERAFQGPFPFLDLASMLLAKGLDPLGSREELLKSQGIKMPEGAKHNALFDTEMTVEIFKGLII